MTFNYDDDADVLYITFASPEGRIQYVQTRRGDVVRFSESTGQVVGVTIQFFMERTQRGEIIEVPEVGAVNFSSIMHSLISGEDRFSQTQH